MKKEFCSTNGFVKFAGTHLIIEVWKAKSKPLSSLSTIKRILQEAIKSCKVTPLKIDLHKFPSSGGVSGVAIIKESHLSIHTWPEYNYAAIDIFVCGNVNPYKVIPVLKKSFETEHIQIMEIKRGIF